MRTQSSRDNSYDLKSYDHDISLRSLTELASMGTASRTSAVLDPQSLFGSCPRWPRWRGLTAGGLLTTAVGIETVDFGVFRLDMSFWEVKPLSFRQVSFCQSTHGETQRLKRPK